MSFVRFVYDRVAFLYDEVCAFYSLGAIARSKRHHLGFLEVGNRVLYVGVGRGADALAAARAGAQVTAVDLSEPMLRRLRSAAIREGLYLELIEGDVSQLPCLGDYDVVVANYFLNMFAESDAQSMLDVLLGQVRPGGRLCLADFAPAAGLGLRRVMTTAYYRLVNGVGWLLGICALHEIPDLPRWLSGRGFEILDIKRFPVAGRSGPAYWAMIARRPSVGLL